MPKTYHLYLGMKTNFSSWKVFSVTVAAIRLLEPLP